MTGVDEVRVTGLLSILSCILVLAVPSFCLGYGVSGLSKLYGGEADYQKMCALFPRMAGGGKWIGQPQNRHKFKVYWNGGVWPSQIVPEDWAMKDLVSQKDTYISLSFATGNPPIFEDRDIGQVDQKLIDGYLPGTVLKWRNEKILYTQTVFVDPLDPKAARRPNAMTMACIRLAMKNTGDTEQDSILWMRYSAPQAYTWSHPFLKDAAGRLRLSMLTDSNVSLSYHDSYKPADDLSNVRWKALEEAGLLKNIFLFRAKLRPGEESSVYIRLPYLPQDEGWSSTLSAHDFTNRLVTWKSRWKREISSVAWVDTPDKLVDDFYRASVAGLMLNPDVDPATGKTYFKTIPGSMYVQVHDCYFVMPVLERLGLHDLSAKGLEPYLDWQGVAPADGKFSTNKGFLMGHPVTEGYFWVNKNGWTLHALCDHYWYTLDEKWYEKVLPNILASCDWIITERKATKVYEGGEHAVNFGLLPEGRATDWVSWQFKETHDSWIANDAYNCWALECAARLLQKHNHPRAEELTREAADYRQCLRDAVMRATNKAARIKYPDGTILPWVPDELHRTTFPSDAGRERAVREHNAWALWLMYAHVGPLELVPTGIFDAREDVITWALKFEEEYPVNLLFPWVTDPRPILANGVSFMLPGFNSNAEACFRRDEVEKYIEAYYGFLACGFSRETYAGVDHTWYLYGQDFVLDTGRAVEMTLRMLLEEQGNDILVAYATPRRWLEDGKRIRVQGVHTRFGEMSYEIVSRASKGSIQASIDPPRRNPPSDMKIKLRLRHPDGKSIRNVKVNGRDWHDFKDDTITFRPDENRRQLVTAMY